MMGTLWHSCRTADLPFSFHVTIWGSFTFRRGRKHGENSLLVAREWGFCLSSFLFHYPARQTEGANNCLSICYKSILSETNEFSCLPVKLSLSIMFFHALSST
jgi:hypothetical protein